MRGTTILVQSDMIFISFLVFSVTSLLAWACDNSCQIEELYATPCEGYAESSFYKLEIHDASYDKDCMVRTNLTRYFTEEASSFGVDVSGTVGAMKHKVNYSVNNVCDELEKLKNSSNDILLAWSSCQSPALYNKEPQIIEHDISNYTEQIRMGQGPLDIIVHVKDFNGEVGKDACVNVKGMIKCDGKTSRGGRAPKKG